MSISPAQNLAKPSPVPGPSTTIATPGAMSAKASPAAIEIGSTVDEPDTEISPLSDERSVDTPPAPAVVPGVVAEDSSSSSLQAASARTAIAVKATSRLEEIMRWAPFVFTVGSDGSGYGTNATKPR